MFPSVDSELLGGKRGICLTHSLTAAFHFLLHAEGSGTNPLVCNDAFSFSSISSELLESHQLIIFPGVLLSLHLLLSHLEDQYLALRYGYLLPSLLLEGSVPRGLHVVKLYIGIQDSSILESSL